jgi:hypothetical protein
MKNQIFLIKIKVIHLWISKSSQIDHNKILI